MVFKEILLPREPTATQPLILRENMLSPTVHTSTSTESHSFYLFPDNDSASFLFVQLVVSNYPSLSYQSTVRHYASDKSAEFVESVSTKKPHSLIVQENGFQVTLNKLTLQFDYAQRVTVDQGKIALDAHWIQHWYVPLGTFKAQLKLKHSTLNLSGSGTFIHNVQSTKPHLLATKWDCLVAHSEGIACVVIAFNAPKHPVPINQAVVVSKSEGLLGATTNVQVLHEKDGTVDPESKYLIPSSTIYTASGYVDPTHSFSFHIGPVAKSTAQSIAKIDILAELPYLIRVVLQTFVARPFTYMWLNSDANLKLTYSVEGTEKVFEGKGRAYHEITFVNAE